MKLAIIVAGLCISAAPAAMGQAVIAQSDTKYMTVDGDVVRYEPGKMIVIRAGDGREVVYNLSPRLIVPSEVRVGRRVKLYTEPGPDGTSQLVQRVVTTSVTPEGNIQRTTEETRNQGATTTTTTTTEITGRVAAYDTGKTLVVTRADGSQVTYVLDPRSSVPADLVIGKTITVVPFTTMVNGRPVVHTITYVTTRPQ